MVQNTRSSPLPLEEVQGVYTSAVVTQLLSTGRTRCQHESELIPAEDELNYIRQYVDLQKLRLNHHTNVFLSINASSGKILIPPMILITFVENAFKYGTSSDTDCKIDIKIDINKEKLILETENAVMKKPENKQPGIGISNCRKRLDLLYPERYKLENGENNGIYRVKLEIDINN